MTRVSWKRVGARPRRSRRGATHVMVAIAIPVILGMAAVAIDIGRVAVEKQRLRQICDVAALEGAKLLPTSPLAVQSEFDPAETAARQYAAANGADRGVTLGLDATPAGGNTSARLRVTANETVPMTFARIWGRESWPLAVSAVAEREPAPGWVPFVIEKKAPRWNLAIRTQQEQVIPLSECAVGQWWVTAVNGTEINFDSAFRDGANQPLHPGDQVRVSQDSSRFTGLVEDVRGRIGQTVQVLLIDDVQKGSDPGFVRGPAQGTAGFLEYATVQFTGVDPQGNALRVKILGEATGELSAGSGTGRNRVRIIE